MTENIFFENLSQWLKYGGALEFQSLPSGNIRVAVADPGGVAPGWSTETKTFHEAIQWSEKKVKKIIESNKKIADMYGTNEVQWPEDEFVMIPGIPPIKNPNFKNTK